METFYPRKMSNKLEQNPVARQSRKRRNKSNNESLKISAVGRAVGRVYRAEAGALGGDDGVRPGGTVLVGRDGGFR